MKKLQWSKLVTLLALMGSFVIMQECLFLMYLCIKSGYTATAAWLTAAVGLAQAVMGATVKYYTGLAETEHSQGGITFECAMKELEHKASADSPQI